MIMRGSVCDVRRLGLLIVGGWSVSLSLLLFHFSRFRSFRRKSVWGLGIFGIA